MSSDMITTFIFDSWGMTNKIYLSNVLCGWFEIVFKLQSAQKAWKTLSDYRLIHLFLVNQTIRSGWHLQKIRKNGDIKKLMELRPILILLKQLRKITMLQSKLVTIFDSHFIKHFGSSGYWYFKLYLILNMYLVRYICKYLGKCWFTVHMHRCSMYNWKNDRVTTSKACKS